MQSPPSPWSPPSRPGPVLVATGLTKRYRDATALAGVSISLEAGTATAVVGPSGSGKSTLLHCLAGFTRPDAGDVTLDGLLIAPRPSSAGSGSGSCSSPTSFWASSPPWRTSPCR